MLFLSLGCQGCPSLRFFPETGLTRSHHDLSTTPKPLHARPQVTEQRTAPWPLALEVVSSHAAPALVPSQVQEADDLRRDVIKAESAAVHVPELDMELGIGTLGGLVTTVEVRGAVPPAMCLAAWAFLIDLKREGVDVFRVQKLPAMILRVSARGQGISQMCRGQLNMLLAGSSPSDISLPCEGQLESYAANCLLQYGAMSWQP